MGTNNKLAQDIHYYVAGIPPSQRHCKASDCVEVAGVSVDRIKSGDAKAAGSGDDDVWCVAYTPVIGWKTCTAFVSLVETLACCGLEELELRRAS